MSTLQQSLRATTLAAIFGVTSLTAGAALAKSPEAPGLFSKVPITPSTVLPREAIAGKSNAVKINRGQLRSGRFLVNLPGGVSYQAVRELHQDFGNGRSSWVGHAGNDPDSSVVLGISGNAVAGSFSYKGKLFKLEPRADGSQVVSEVNATDPAPELDAIPVADTVSTAPASTVSGDSSADSAGAVIDVLVAYTPAIRSLYGTPGAEALIIQAVAEANLAYTNSKMTTRLNLVSSVETSYTESGDMLTDLSRLRTTNDGYLDELHTLRNTYNADIVSLIADAPQYCGLAYRMATLSASFASSAFSVIHHSCATGYYSFAHEIGHNQGAHHDSANASGAIFPYAYGYQDPYNRFRTVMAYDCPGGCNRAALFSSGDNPIWGVPTGDSNYAANAATIDQTASTVAAFRQAVAAPQPIAAPSDLNSIQSGPDYISLRWADRSSDESGFLLERSVDGFNYTQIASLPVNTSTYVDTNLQAATLYNYRVRAWNSGAYSGYSNVATAPTEAATPTQNVPPAFDLTASGYKVKGRQRANLTWSGAQSQTVDIYRDSSKLRSAVVDSGSYLDNINSKGAGTYTYKVCEAGKNVCSNAAVVSF